MSKKGSSSTAVRPLKAYYRRASSETCQYISIVPSMRVS